MKLSDAIEAGAGVLKTMGPSHVISPVFVGLDVVGGPPRTMAVNDVLSAAQLGLLGRVPTQEEYLAFYWSNPWGATHNTPLLMWMRLTESHHYRWADVINELRAYGA